MHGVCCPKIPQPSYLIDVARSAPPSLSLASRVKLARAADSTASQQTTTSCISMRRPLGLRCVWDEGRQAAGSARPYEWVATDEFSLGVSLCVISSGILPRSSYDLCVSFILGYRIPVTGCSERYMHAHTSPLPEALCIC